MRGGFFHHGRKQRPTPKPLRRKIIIITPSQLEDLEEELSEPEEEKKK